MSIESPGSISRQSMLLLVLTSMIGLGMCRPHGPVLVNPYPYSWAHPFGFQYSSHYLIPHFTQPYSIGPVPVSNSFQSTQLYPINFPFPSPQYIPVENAVHSHLPEVAETGSRSVNNKAHGTFLSESVINREKDESSDRTVPLKLVGSRPPPTQEEEEHLAKLEKEFDLLKLPKDTGVKSGSSVPIHEQFTPALFQVFSSHKKNPSQANQNVGPDYVDIDPLLGSFSSEEQTNNENMHSIKLNTRISGKARIKNINSRRSMENIRSKRFLAIITAVIKHNNHRRRQRQLGVNDMSVTNEQKPSTTENVLMKELPPMLVEDKIPSLEIEPVEVITPVNPIVNSGNTPHGEEDRTTNSGNNLLPYPFRSEAEREDEKNGEMMEFSDEDTLFPTDRLFSPGPARSLAMMDLVMKYMGNSLADSENSTNQVIDVISNVDYELSNDTFSGDIAKDLPPVVYVEMHEPIENAPTDTAAELDKDTVSKSFESQKTTPKQVTHSEGKNLEIENNSVKSEGESADYELDGYLQSDFPPIPSSQLFEDNSIGLNDLPVSTPPVLNSSSIQNIEPSEPAGSVLPEVNTSDLPPLPGSFFPEDEMDKVTSTISTPQVQVDDLVSSDLPPLPDISLFPISSTSTENDQVQIPLLPQTPSEIVPETRLSTTTTQKPIFQGGDLPPLFPQSDEYEDLFSKIPSSFQDFDYSPSTTSKPIVLPIPTTSSTSPPSTSTLEEEINISPPENSDPESPLTPNVPVQAPNNSNDWIRDFALKALDRGISVQHIYSINIGKINIKSEQQPLSQGYKSSSITDTNQNIIGSLQDTVRKVVDAVNQSVKVLNESIVPKQG